MDHWARSAWEGGTDDDAQVRRPASWFGRYLPVERWGGNGRFAEVFLSEFSRFRHSITHAELNWGEVTQ